MSFVDILFGSFGVWSTRQKMRKKIFFHPLKHLWYMTEKEERIRKGERERERERERKKLFLVYYCYSSELV